MNASGFVLSTFDLKYVLSKSHNTGAMNFKSPSIPEGKCTVAEEDLALSMQDLASRKQDLASTKERHVIDWSVWHTLLAFQSIPSSILEIVKPERSFWESFGKERRHRNTWMTVIDTSRSASRVRRHCNTWMTRSSTLPSRIPIYSQYLKDFLRIVWKEKRIATRDWPVITLLLLDISSVALFPVQNPHRTRAGTLIHYLLYSLPLEPLLASMGIKRIKPPSIPHLPDRNTTKTPIFLLYGVILLLP